MYIFLITVLFVFFCATASEYMDYTLEPLIIFGFFWFGYPLLLKTSIKAQKIITAILIILALIICFKAWDTAVKYEALKKDKQALEDITEMQRSMISDLEANCKELFIQVEELKYGEQR